MSADLAEEKTVLFQYRSAIYVVAHDRIGAIPMTLSTVTAQDTPTSHSWLALALTFLLLGLGYGLPTQLVHAAPAGMWQGQVAPEILNLYAVTAFAGWAHFIYAWRGQWSAVGRLGRVWRWGYWVLVAASLGVLVALRAVLGVALFSGLAWIWFIGHFVKAETVFAGPTRSADRGAWLVSIQPVAAFAWLSLVLFDVGHIQQHRWTLYIVSIALGVAMLAAGGWRQLVAGTRKLPVVALFFLGESLVWGTYGPYMTPAFRIGVYVFHVAGASFFHYIGSYAFGRSRGADRWLGIAPIVLVNAVVIALGCAVAANRPNAFLSTALIPVFGLSWFTLWVALHLAASDLLPVWKRLGKMPR